MCAMTKGHLDQLYGPMYNKGFTQGQASQQQNQTMALNGNVSSGTAFPQNQPTSIASAPKVAPKFNFRSSPFSIQQEQAGSESGLNVG